MSHLMNEMVGQVFTSVRREHNDWHGDIIIFENDDVKFTFKHYQSCCESVSIHEIVGDLNDLVGLPLVEAEESGSLDTTAGDYNDCQEEWTFYKFRTKNGMVTISWFGSSNGFYSTSVSIKKENKKSV